MLNFYIYSTLGIIFGTTIAMFHTESSFIIKLVILLLLFNIVFYIINKRFYKNIEFKQFLKYSSILLISFTLSNIYIYSFEKNNINKDKQTLQTKLKILNKTETDDKLVLKLADEFHKKYYFAQNLKFADSNKKALKDIKIGETYCMQSDIYTSYIFYSYDQNINSSFDIALHYKGIGYDYYAKTLKVLTLDDCLQTNTKKTIAISDAFFTATEKILSLKNTISQKALTYFRSNLEKAGASNYETSLMMAMSWGDERLLTKETENLFRDSGLSHMLVLSGFNLAIILSLIFIALKKTSVRKKVILSFIFLLIFMTLANTSVPVWRAFMMSLYGLLTYYFYKQDNIRYSLWISLFIFCLSSPLSAILDMSLHLSFLATLGIIYIYEPLETFIKSVFEKKDFNSRDHSDDARINKITKIRLSDNKTLNKITGEIFDYIDFSNIKNILLSTILITISASMLLIPYLIYQFNTYNFWSILFNVFVTFFIPIVTIISIILSLVYIPILSYILYIISSICIKIISFFAEISADVYDKNYIIEISIFQMIVIYFLIYIFYRSMVFYNKINK